jgi:hypothetical protein
MRIDSNWNDLISYLNNNGNNGLILLKYNFEVKNKNRKCFVSDLLNLSEKKIQRIERRLIENRELESNQIA